MTDLNTKSWPDNLKRNSCSYVYHIVSDSVLSYNGYQISLEYSTRSIIPLFVNSGSKRPARSFISIFSFSTTGRYMTFERIERESQNWTRRRSTSSHCAPGVVDMIHSKPAPSSWSHVRVDCGLLEISMSRYDGFKCCGDPFTARVSALKHDTF